jgi:hypothetical protein
MIPIIKMTLMPPLIRAKPGVVINLAVEEDINELF